MKENTNPIDSRDAALQKLSYELWKKNQCARYSISPEKRTVDIYAVVRSVIENDLSDSERFAVHCYWYEGRTISSIAQRMSVSHSAVYHTLDRAKQKIRFVLKHIIDCEVVLTQTDNSSEP